MKKVLSVILALTLALSCVAIFAGCGDSTGDAQSAGEATAKTEVKKLVMGTNAHFAPYEFVDDGGAFAGIDVEIAGKVAEKLGMELEIKDMEFDSLLTAVQGGVVDVVFAGLTVTDERLEQVNFTQTYAVGKQVIVVKNGSDIKTADDLAGQTVGVQSGTTGDIYCTDDFGQDNVKAYPNGAEAIVALQNGQVDCVVIDNEPAKVFVSANAGLEILETEYVQEDYAAAVAKENTELLDNMNKAMTELTEDGTIANILAKYIKAE